mmetsp:Transcript_43965/g.131296  ORF Transcript_43965/g.131296 Transcript_43965/m.131296 type:complete len:319 (-) Transcript_43965:743-1699(-)
MRHHVSQALAQDCVPLPRVYWLAHGSGQEADLLSPVVLVDHTQAAWDPALAQDHVAVGASLEAVAHALVQLVREVGRQEVKVAQPGADPAVRHHDVALENLAAPGVDLGDTHADHLAADGPTDCAEARVTDVVVLRPILVLRQHCPHCLGTADESEGVVPCLDAFAEPASPALGHGGVDVDADLALWTLHVVPPDRGDLAVDALLGELVGVAVVLAQVLVVSREVEEAFVRWPEGHRLIRQLDEGETNRHGVAVRHHVLHSNVQVLLVGLHAEHAVGGGLRRRLGNEEALPDQAAAADDHTLRLVRLAGGALTCTRCS